MRDDEWRGVTDLAAGLGVVVIALSAAQSLWAGDPRFLLGAGLGAAWVVLAATGWGRPADGGPPVER